MREGGPASWLRRLLARARSRVRGLFRRGAVEAEILEEFEHHIEMRTRHWVREGLAPRDAARRARREFGHVETWREEARASRGARLPGPIRFSWIDVKLGARMLVKSPVLTLVAGFALAVGIPVGLAPGHLADALMAPLPEDRENRIRALRIWVPEIQGLAPVRYDDYRFWAERLDAFDRLGAHRSGSYAVSGAGRSARSVFGARVTGSVFEMLRTPPHLGRALDRGDEQPGAPDVVVVGYDLWRSWLAADPGIVGKTLRVAGAPRTVVGVMPPGFHFPHRQQVWLPLRAPEDPTALPVGVVARLAEGRADSAGQAELTAAGLAPRPGEPGGSRLQPEVVPFALGVAGVPRGGLTAVQGFGVMQVAALCLLLVACGNVAMLVFARTATRVRELAVRTAIGASRGRIVGQIFVETLVLAAGAAALGVVAISWLVGRVDLAALAGEAAVPYWLSFAPTPRTALQALALAVGSATIAGVAPALRVTGRGIQRTIQRAGAGGGRTRLGGLTGALVVADVAVSVAAVALAGGLVDRMTDRRTADELAGVPASEFLAVEVRLPPGDPGRGPDADPAGRAETHRAFVERLAAEPGVLAVGAADALPRMDHPARLLEVEGVETDPDGPGNWVRTARVEPGYFEALGTPVLAGRGFDPGDVESSDRPVVVNTVFVERTLGGADPLGRRVRFPSRSGGDDAPWLEIVGVVGHLGSNMVNPGGGEAVYAPAAPGEIQPLRLAVHVRGSAADAGVPVRELAAALHPDLVVEAPVPLSRIHQGDWYITLAVAGGLAALVAILLGLAASGLYAILSFSVSERTREIGIRTALGAPRGSVLATVFRRALSQVALGAALGLPLAAAILGKLPGSAGSTASTVGAAALVAAGVVGVVAVASCLVPARRALAIEAAEALRAEA